MQSLTRDELETIKNEFSEYHKALKLVSAAFRGKTDKSGAAYSGHLFRVAEPFHDDATKTVALLHDTIEDTDITREDLLEMGFKELVVESVEILTRQEGEIYKDYIKRIANSDSLMAKQVKMSDLLDNMNLNRLNNLTKEDFNRVKTRYLESYQIILESLEKSID